MFGDPGHETWPKDTAAILSVIVVRFLCFFTKETLLSTWPVHKVAFLAACRSIVDLRRMGRGKTVNDNAQEEQTGKSQHYNMAYG